MYNIFVTISYNNRIIIYKKNIVLTVIDCVIVVLRCLPYSGHETSETGN